MMKNYSTILIIFAGLFFLGSGFTVSAGDDGPQNKKTTVTVGKIGDDDKIIIMKRIKEDGKVTIDTITLDAGSDQVHKSHISIYSLGDNGEVFVSDSIGGKLLNFTDDHKTVFYNFSEDEDGEVVIKSIGDDDKEAHVFVTTLVDGDAKKCEKILFHKKKDFLINKDDPSIIKYERKMIGDDKEKIVIIRKVDKDEK